MPGKHRPRRAVLSRLKARVAIFQIRFLRFKSLFLRMSLSQTRCTVLCDTP